MPDVLQVELGPVDVQVNGVDIGHCKGGAEVMYEANWKEQSVDKYGSSPVQAILTGERLTAKIRMAEYNMVNLKRAMPAATYAGAANTRLLLGSKVGKRASDNFVQLVLHPTANNTRKHDIVLYKALPMGSVVLNHTTEDDKVIEVEFVAFIDESKNDGNYLGLIGDSTT